MANPYRKPDRFAKQAKAEGYAARSVYKLEEIDRRHRLLSQGQRVVDLGCFPGSWSRYALERIGGKGKLVGVDFEIPSLVEGTYLQGSALDVTPEALLAALGGPADVVLSDMAQATTGDRFGDHVRQVELARRAFEIALAVVRPGGAFVAKVFEGEDAHPFEKDVRAVFDEVKRLRPEAVRKISREFFLVAKNRR